MTRMTVAMPAPLVAAGAGLPRVCARHGEPATRHRRVVFRSATPWWAYLLLPFGLLPYAIVAMVVQKQVKAPAWPFCGRCGRLTARRIVAGMAGVAGGTVTRDGGSVEFRRPHPAFAERVEGTRRQWATQQQYWETQTQQLR
jgi:hypothetical protein